MKKKKNLIAKKPITKNQHYSIWRNMMDSVYKPTHPRYSTNLQKGVKVAEEWHDFNKWLKDMGERPSMNHYFKRRNLRGNYQKDNCYWGVYSYNLTNDQQPFKQKNDDVGDLFDL